MISRQGILRRIFYVRSSRLAEVPPAPGTTPIPDDHVRLYHYTGNQKGGQGEANEKMAENLRRGGIDINKSRTTTYGEPHVVWASTKPPGGHKVVSEFKLLYFPI